MINLTSTVIKTNENVKRVLGDFYLDIEQEKDKKKIVEVINNFINQKQFHKLVNNKKCIKRSDNCLQLPIDAFITYPNITMSQWMCNNYQYCFIYEKTTKKIYFCITTSYHHPNIGDSLTERFGIAALRRFYICIVRNNVSIALKLRYIKEINNKCKNLKEIPKYLGFKLKGSSDIFFIKDVRCEGPDNDRVTLLTQRYSAYNRTLGQVRSEWWSYKAIRNKLEKEWIPSQLVDIRGIIEDNYKEKEEYLRKEIEKLKIEKDETLNIFN